MRRRRNQVQYSYSTLNSLGVITSTRYHKKYINIKRPRQSLTEQIEDLNGKPTFECCEEVENVGTIATCLTKHFLRFLKFHFSNYHFRIFPFHLITLFKEKLIKLHKLKLTVSISPS